MGEVARLTPTMRSRKLQALDFIKTYMARWGASPTLSEIGAELGVSKQHASDLVGQLSRDEQIRRVVGKTRGIELIDPAEAISQADAMRQLARLGWVVDEEGLTKIGLPCRPELDHDPDD